MFILWVLFSLLPYVRAQVAQTSTPTITLPWNTYTATPLPNSTYIWKFQNVRFGAAPTGTMRFGSPAFPTESNIPDPEGDVRCWNYHRDTENIVKGVPYLGEPAILNQDVAETEDCLFLDVYVPASVFKKENSIPKVPVIVWFYGGAYISGSKGGFANNTILYTGVGPIDSAQAFGKDVIFVVGNYRLGAFGWLAGSYMEASGRPNAGLYDQRLLLQWVQKYIHQVGGDQTQTSAWGESAGASSILHHLIQYDGRTDPWFSKAVLQSPAFEWQWDRSGTLNDTYTDFATKVAPYCASADIACLRKLPLNHPALVNANQDLLSQTYNKTGLFPLGPAVDGVIVKQLPVTAFINGAYWRDIESIIVSHVLDEASIFVPQWINTDEDFTTFINDFMPQATLSGARVAIAEQYPASSFKDAKHRAGAVIRDSTFTCNTRVLFDAYYNITSTYMMQYAVGELFNGAIHGTDLAPTFWNAHVDFAQLLYDTANEFGYDLSKWKANFIARFFGGFPEYYASHYQSYLSSHAVYGSPNNGSFANIPWPPAIPTEDGRIGKVLQAQPSTRRFQRITDDQNTQAACDFWTNIAGMIGANIDDHAFSAGKQRPEYSEKMDL